MTEDQIKYMVDRFLGWKLPESFNPDAGISFNRLSYQHSAETMPSGTNLFDATQAGAMVRYLLSGLPVASTDQVAVAAREEAERFYEKGDDTRFDRAAFVDGANFGARLAASEAGTQEPVAWATENQIITGAMAIARSQGHDPDEPAPLTVMCTEYNTPVPWWMVFVEESEACLKAVAAPASQDATRELAEELREYTAMKYAGDCKCGKCHLVPRALVERIYHTLNASPARADRAVTADDRENLKWTEWDGAVYTDQPIFDAIAAATEIDKEPDGFPRIVMSVGKFIAAFNGHRDRELCTSIGPSRAAIVAEIADRLRAAYPDHAAIDAYCAAIRSFSPPNLTERIK